MDAEGSADTFWRYSPAGGGPLGPNPLPSVDMYRSRSSDGKKKIRLCRGTQAEDMIFSQVVWSSGGRLEILGVDKGMKRQATWLEIPIGIDFA